MKPLVRNLFLLFGIVAIMVMLYTFDVDFSEMEFNIRRAGLYLPAVIGVWIFVYLFNALAFKTIVNSGTHDKHLSLRHAYRLTISAFAFSYTTPFGFGGGPYRVMELNSYIGTARAMSSVVLYSMMHILSHFCFWAIAAVLFLVFYWHLMNPVYWIFFALFTLVLVGVYYFFAWGYKNGVIVWLYGLIMRIPLLKPYARRFHDKHKEDMERVDEYTAYLHSQPRAFYSSLACEIIGRLINSLEFFFILRSLSIDVGYADSIIILGFASLIGNILFFLPMQLGAREGGLAIIVRLLGLGDPALGIITGFYSRVRELFWVFVGVVLVKVGYKRIMR